LFINNRVDTNETATSVLEHQSHTSGNEAIAEEDEGTQADGSTAAVSALSGRETAVTQSADSDAVLNEWVTFFLSMNYQLIISVCDK